MIKLNQLVEPRAEAEDSVTRFADFLSEFAESLKKHATPEAFYRRWLVAIVDFVSAEGAALRLRDEAGAWSTIATSTFPKLDLGTEHVPSRHGTLVFETFVSGRIKLIPPLSQRKQDPEANPTERTLLVAPLVIAEIHQGVVELLLPPESTAAEHGETLRAITQAAELIAAFRHQQQDRLQAKLACVEELERFTQAVHERLDVRHIAYVIANEGKRLVGSDRLTVFLRRGRKYDLTAVSGLDVVETRSEAAKLLSALAAEACRVGEALEYPGELESLTPPIRAALEAYVDETHVRALAIIPLLPPKSKENTPSGDVSEPAALPLGGLVIEHFADVTEARRQAERGRFLAEHASSALANGLRHERIPLLPLWRAWDRVALQFAPGTRKRTLAIMAAVAVSLATLAFAPADFTIPADGVLRPAEQRSAFAPWDGTVKTLFVRHGDHVVVGEPLLELQNVDLEVTLAETAGKRTAAQEQLTAVERSLYENSSQLAIQERHRLSGQRSELKQRVIALDQQLELLKRKNAQLLVTSPLDGEVVTWNLEQLLSNRPVRAGQVLLEVGRTSAAWELELQVPEDDIGHVLRAQRAQSDALEVRYRLAAAPAQEYRATIREVHLAAEVRGEKGNTVLVRAALPPENLPPQRPGAAAATKIYCGRRSVGYVWLHDAVDYLRTKVLFRI
ncbi:MAG: efflux RND transporter periplasmic adaptor subunit [Planctomycetia bacterium]|nr:efflux RND transporter periplasmic adaptor subunit [Planctomycetia bacterium]